MLKKILVIMSFLSSVSAYAFCPSNSTGEMREYLSNLRRSGTYCDGVWYPPVRSNLGSPTALHLSALRHARDMASTGIFDHRGSDGSTPTIRAQRAGYPGVAGENIAAGTDSDTTWEAFQQWVHSPKHCINMMNADYEDFGVACEYNADSEYKYYWVQTLGVRR